MTEAELKIFEKAASAAVQGQRRHNAVAALLQDAYLRMAEAQRLIAEQARTIRRLEDLAETDPLTGAMNRRGLEKFFAQEMERIRRYDSPGGVLVLIDLDGFKPINDLHGHDAGDACLKMVAAFLKKSTRLPDGVARFGGDEFAVLFTRTTAEKVARRLEKLKRDLNSLRLDWGGQPLHFGASLGAAEIAGGQDFAAVYRAADQALYLHKRVRCALKPAQSLEKRIAKRRAERLMADANIVAALSLSEAVF